jgi:hypothetical protein
VEQIVICTKSSTGEFLSFIYLRSTTCEMKIILRCSLDLAGVTQSNGTANMHLIRHLTIGKRYNFCSIRVSAFGASSHRAREGQSQCVDDW